MGTSLVRYQNQSQEIGWGRLEDGLVTALAGGYRSLAALLAARAWEQNGGAKLHPASLRFLPPVTAPCQIVCQGKNYLDHLRETGVRPADKDFNLLFTKADSSLHPPHEPVLRPAGVRLLDYEIELGLVLGKAIPPGAKLNTEDLPDYVAGLVMANDLSARDVQVPQRQWLKGKSFRGFCPVGPVLYLPTRQEFHLFDNLELHLSVNGETRQRGSTKQLIYGPAETLSEIAQIFDMRAGDLLLTGTPGGVAMRVRPGTWIQDFLGTFRTEKEKFARFVEEQARSPRYLKDGDRVEGSIRTPDGKIDLGRQAFTISPSNT